MLVDLETARRIIQEKIGSKLKVAIVSSIDSIGRIAAEDIYSPKNIPEQDISAMDGYAFRIEDYNKFGKLKVVGKIFPDTKYVPILNEGEAYYVTTGAPLPKNANTVVRLEASKVVDGYLYVGEEVFKGKDIRVRGEDVKEGEVIIPKGKEITAYDIGLLFRLGIKNLKVLNYNTCIFAVGDELEPFTSNKNGLVDSISPILLSILRKFGESRYLGVVNDEFDNIKKKLKSAIEGKCDIVFTIGGSSVGERDYIKKVVREIGELLFEGVNVNVLKRAGVGVINGKPVVILPGQVVSSVTAFHEHGLGVISRMCEIQLKRIFKSKLGSDIEVTHKMDSLYLFKSQGEYVFPLRWGVGLYSELTKADSFGILKRNRNYKKGEEIELQRLLL